MRTHNIPLCQETRKVYPSYISCPGAINNTHSLELPLDHICMGLKVFEPLKFGYTSTDE